MSARKAALVRVEVDQPVAVDGDEVDVPAATRERLRRLDDGRVLDRADDEVAGLEALQVAGEGQVVGLGAAGGEDDLALGGAEGRGDGGARRFDGAPPLAAQRVQLGRVAVALAEVRQHRLEDARVDRRGRGVVEVDGLHRRAPSATRSSQGDALERLGDRLVEAPPDDARGAALGARAGCGRRMQSTRVSGPSRAVTTSPTATRSGRAGEGIAAARPARRPHETGVAQPRRGCARGTAPGMPSLGGDLGERRRALLRACRPGTPWPAGRTRCAR